MVASSGTWCPYRAGVLDLIKPNEWQSVHYPSAQTGVISIPKLVPATSNQSAACVWTWLMGVGIYFVFFQGGGDGAV